MFPQSVLHLHFLQICLKFIRTSAVLKNFLNDYFPIQPFPILIITAERTFFLLRLKYRKIESSTSFCSISHVPQVTYYWLEFMQPDLFLNVYKIYIYKLYTCSHIKKKLEKVGNC